VKDKLLGAIGEEKLIEMLPAIDLGVGIEKELGGLPTVEQVKEAFTAANHYSQFVESLRKDPGATMLDLIRSEQGIDEMGNSIIASIGAVLDDPKVAPAAYKAVADPILRAMHFDVKKMYDDWDLEESAAKNQGKLEAAGQAELQKFKASIMLEFLEPLLGLKPGERPTAAAPAPGVAPKAAVDPKVAELEAELNRIKEEKAREVQAQQQAALQTRDAELGKERAELVEGFISGKIQGLTPYLKEALTKDIVGALNEKLKGKTGETIRQSVIQSLQPGQKGAEAWTLAKTQYGAFVKRYLGEVAKPLIEKAGLQLVEQSKATAEAVQAGAAKVGVAGQPGGGDLGQGAISKDVFVRKPGETDAQYNERVRPLFEKRLTRV
jgi:hypothetical protein